MNKNVFNYLNEKANDVADYIKAKAEAAGTYLSEHAQDIKQGAIKGTATVLTAAMLLGGMTGCGDFGFNSNNYEQKFPISTVRPIEDIEEQGITAQDVLAAYDTISLAALKGLMASSKDDYGSRWDCFSAKFEGITPCEQFVFTEGADGTMKQNPFLFPVNNYVPNHLWLNDSAISYDNVYEINFNYTGDITTTTLDRTISHLGISEQDFVAIMESFNIQPFELTSEYLDSLDFSAPLYEDYLGQLVYPAFSLNREMILNANEEQLWALYNAATNSISNINFLEPVLDNSKEQTIN